MQVIRDHSGKPSAGRLGSLVLIASGCAVVVLDAFGFSGMLPWQAPIALCILGVMGQSATKLIEPGGFLSTR